MSVWLLMLAAIILLWFLIPENLGKKKKELIFLIFSGLLMGFLMGSRCPQRSSTGDVYVYYIVYLKTAIEPVEDILKHYSMEESYLYINKFLVSIVPWGQFIVYLEGFFTTFAVFRFIYKNSRNAFLGVIVYICTGGWGFITTGFRQAFAMSFCLIAFEFMKKKNLKDDLKALLFVFFASLFHSTAWIFLAVFLLRNVKINKFKVFWTVVGTALAFVMMNPFVDAIEKLMGSSYRVGYDGNIFGGLIPIAVYLAALVLSYLAWIKNKSFLEENGFILVLLFVGLCLYMFRYNTMVFERMSYYFTIVICAALPNAIEAIDDARTKTVVKALCVVLCLCLFAYRESSEVYYFYWEG